jgi:hypothetical protein
MEEKEIPIKLKKEEEEVKEQKDLREKILEKLLETREKEDAVVSLLRLTTARELLEKKEQKESELDLNKILAIFAIKTAFQPQTQSIDPTLLLLLTRSHDNSQLSQFMQAYLQQQSQALQQQVQFNQQLMAMLFGQKIQKTEQTVQAIQESLQEYLKQVNEKIESLRSQIQSSQNPQPDLLQQLEYEIKKKEMLEKFAQEFKPKEIVTESGKINWGKFVEKGLNVFEKFVEKLPAQVPTLKTVQPIPTNVSQTIQEVQNTQQEPTLPTIEDIIKESKREIK